MALLTRDQIRAIDTGAKVTSTITVPEWGGDVMFRRPSVLEQEQYWLIMDDAKDGKPHPAGKRGALVLMCCVNADGSDLFDEDDAPWLGSQANRTAIDLVFNAIWQFSGVTQEALADIEKKPEGPTNSSSTGSLTDGTGPMSTG